MTADTRDPALDLELIRQFRAPPAAVWRALTEAELLKRWFCPAPWRISEAVLEPWPGGRFYTRMRGPEGQDLPNEGCVLAVERERRLVFTDALTAGFRPAASGFMTAILSLAPKDGGTVYRAEALHADAARRQEHLRIGFHEGWGAAADQLGALLAGP